MPGLQGHTCGQRGHTADLTVESEKLNCNRKFTKYQPLVQLKKIKALKIKENSLPINHHLAFTFLSFSA